MKVLDVDLHGVFFCAREALKIMVEQGHGKIINIASMWGLAGGSSVFRTRLGASDFMTGQTLVVDGGCMAK